MAFFSYMHKNDNTNIEVEIYDKQLGGTEAEAVSLELKVVSDFYFVMPTYMDKCSR